MEWQCVLHVSAALTAFSRGLKYCMVTEEIFFRTVNKYTARKYLTFTNEKSIMHTKY